MRQRLASGLSLWIDDVGAGAPLLCISGLGYSSWCWDELRAALAPRRRVLTFDNRGTGRSDQPAGRWSIADMADDAAAVLDAAGVGASAVLGHSMGGYIALTLALRHPQRVASLVLVGTSPGGPDSLPVPEDTQAVWRSAFGLSAEAAARRSMPLSFPPGWTGRHPARFEEFLLRRAAHPTPPACWLAQFKACADYVEQGVPVERIDCPALVLHGDADRVVPFENGERLARRLPRARWLPLAGAGHIPYLEDPAAFARSVEAFLAAPAGAAA